MLTKRFIPPVDSLSHAGSLGSTSTSAADGIDRRPAASRIAGVVGNSEEQDW